LSGNAGGGHRIRPPCRWSGPDAHSTEFRKDTLHPVIALITEWTDGDGTVQQRREGGDLGGSMRLGAQPCRLMADSLARTAYGKDVITERHRHRYEFNNRYREPLQAAGLALSGHSLDDRLVEMIELPDHPWFLWLPVPPGIHLQSARRTPVVSGVRRGGDSATPATPAGECHIMMKLCGFEVGLDRPLFLIAGPCVIESEQLALDTAGQLKDITGRLGIPFIYKSSFRQGQPLFASKLSRSWLWKKGLKILEKVKSQIGVPVLTDVHEYTPLAEVAAVADVLQTPAFLCRQTDFIQNVARQGRPVNIKKGQFLSPWDMRNVVAKARMAGNDQMMVCERGASFGYNNLVSDMRSLMVMRTTGCPVVFDATHSVQLPGGQGHASGGQREFVPVLARAAVAAGIAGLFMETHPDPGSCPERWPQRLAAGSDGTAVGDASGAGRIG
jgi:2-dehydro-3-deoxyphosphooctonate aldolase (KDO 8-P synthase)